MRKLIRDVKEAHGESYQVWAEVYRIDSPGHTVCLQFNSVWAGARDPGANQSKGQFFLTLDEVDSLIDMLQDAKNL